MAYELRPGADLSGELNRILGEQIGLASKELADTSDRARSVHEARKAIKRSRALIRLYNPGNESKSLRKLENRLRTIARGLSGARNAQAMLETLARLEEHYGERWNVNLVQGLRAAFYGQKQRAESLLQPAAEQTAARLEKPRARAESLSLKASDRLLYRGVHATYTRARDCYKTAYTQGHGTAFHDWRRDLQRHWRQMQLLTAAWPEELTVRIRRASALSKCLGEDHDLHMLLGFIRGRGAEMAGWAELESFFDGCIERQAALRIKASNHGQLLFAEKPKAFTTRMMRYWGSAEARFSQGAPANVWDLRPEGVIPFPASTSETDPLTGEGQPSAS